jgi:hypothetical protein
MTWSTRYWPLLLPLTYMVHIAEEYYGGFPGWASQYLGLQLTPEEFVRINMIAWTVMLCVSVIAISYSSLSWLMIPFAAATLINGCAHTIASAVTRSYSPGVVSGLTLWVPLGVVVLRGMYRRVSRKLFWFSIALGIFLHVAVTVMARVR